MKRKILKGFLIFVIIICIVFFLGSLITSIIQGIGPAAAISTMFLIPVVLAWIPLHRMRKQQLKEKSLAVTTAQPSEITQRRSIFVTGKKDIILSAIKALAVLAIIPVLILISMHFERNTSGDEAALAPFKPYVHEYLSNTGLSDERYKNDVYIHGKVIIMDTSIEGSRTSSEGTSYMDKYGTYTSASGEIKETLGAFDRVFFSIPKELQAVTPEEVGTIIWLHWSGETVGYYNNGAPGIQQYCIVTIIDKSKQVILGERKIYGPEPPPYLINSSGPGTGAQPLDEVANYIISLPRR